MHPIIVGIDPGTTSAFAAISFDFNILKVKSKKEYSLGELISDIYELGNPIIVGTDKKEVPSFIKEFSQKTGARIYSPKYDTKKGEKRALVSTSRFSKIAKNTHETDALASAIYAYNDYKPLIVKINQYVEKNNKQEIFDKILMKVITQELSIVQAVLEIEKKPIKQIQKIKKIHIQKEKILTSEQKEIFLLKKVIEELREERVPKEVKQKKIDIDKHMKELVAFKEKRIHFLENNNRLLRKEIRAKDKIIKKLDSFIAQTKDSVLIKKIQTLGSEDYNKCKIATDDILLVDDIRIYSEKVIKEIKDKVKIIIYNQGKAKLDDFLLIEKKNLPLIETKYFALAPKDRFDTEVEKLKLTTKKDSTYLKGILDDYKRERFSDNIE
jgi:hypothetical protein